VLDHRKFWDAMHAVDTAALQEISARLTARMIERYQLDLSSVALDMTNFATYIDTANTKAPIAQRGKAKQKRSDLRLVGLGMVVTRAGGIPAREPRCAMMAPSPLVPTHIQSTSRSPAWLTSRATR
jgi:transposase